MADPLTTQYAYGNIGTATYNAALMDDHDALYAQYRKFRDYDEGNHPERIVDKEKEILGDRVESLNVNICPRINEAERDREKVRQLTISEDGNPEHSDELTALARKWWKLSRMDEGQRNLHYAAGRDGDAYLIVEWDNDKGRPMFYFNPAYDGTSGVEIFYIDDDPMRPMYAVKRWTQQLRDANGNRVRRQNVYLEDRVLKMASTVQSISTSGGQELSDYGWEPYLDDTTDPEPVAWNMNGRKIMAGVSWWTDNMQPSASDPTKSVPAEGGNPLGIPVFHFRHSANGMAYGRSNLADIVPDVQDAINLASHTYIAGARLAGFDVAWVTGYYKEGVTIARHPGAMMMFEHPDVNVGTLPATSIEQLGGAIDRYLRYAATLTSTPLVMLNPTGNIAAEGTLQQMEAPLVAKVENNQVAYGNAYEDAVRMALRLALVFGDAEAMALEMDALDALEIDCEWESAKTRNEREDVELEAIKVSQLGVPREVVWEKFYTPEQIEEMKASTEIKRNVVVGSLAQQILAQGQDDGTGTVAATVANGGQPGNGAQPGNSGARGAG